MKKYNRVIDKARLEESKERSMNIVMNKIHLSKQESFVTTLMRSLKRLSPLLVGVFVVAAVLIFTGNSMIPSPQTTVELSEQETETLATLSYLSGSLLYTSTTAVNDSSLMFLADTDEFEFEQNIEEINTYFDTLKVFLDDEAINDQVTVTYLEDSEFDVLLEMNMNDQVFEFYLKMNDDEEHFTGEIEIAGMFMSVEGSIVEEENEVKFELTATDKENSIHLEYQSEIDSLEFEKEFQIETTLNGVTKEKQVRISKEQNEAKVEITETNKEFQLKKEIENGVVEYKLEYEVDGVSGEARIKEIIDASGKATYSYHISENGKEKDIEVGRPDFAGRNGDDDEFPGNNNNNPNNDEDTDFPPGKGNNSDEKTEEDTEDQSNESIIEPTKQII